MSNAYFRDIKVLAGEDVNFVLSACFKYLHGHMRRNAAKIVIVPFYSGADCDLVASNSVRPNALRLFAANEKDLNFSLCNEGISNAVCIHPVKNVQNANGSLSIERVRANDAQSKINRHERHEAYSSYSYARKNKPNYYFHVEKDRNKYIIAINVIKRNDVAPFESHNSYGFGCCPNNFN